MDYNTRRKLPLPADVKCAACEFVWKQGQGAITISQCETYRRAPSASSTTRTVLCPSVHDT